MLRTGLGAGTTNAAVYWSAVVSPGVPFWFWSIGVWSADRICGPITMRYVPTALCARKLTCRCCASIQVKPLICGVRSTAGPEVGVKVKLATSSVVEKVVVSIGALKVKTSEETGPVTLPLGELPVTNGPEGGAGV